MNGIEKQIVREIAKRLIAKGHNISVDFDRGYDCEDQYRNLTNIDKIVEGCDAVDECWWMLDAIAKPSPNCAQDTSGYLYFIWANGNEGRDCLSDYTTNLEEIVEPVSRWIDEAEIALVGEPA